MAEIKWIKIVTDLFDDAKMLLIDEEKDRDKIIVIWLKLLCLAGKQNNGGVFRINEKTPYTMEMFARYFQRPKKDIAHAFNVFTKLGMIEYEKGAVKITNWERHQNFESTDRKREQNRERVQAYRERERYKSVTSNADESITSALRVTQNETLRNANVTHTEEEREEDKNINIYMTSPLSPPLRNTERYIPAAADRVVELWRDLCPSFAGVVGMSDKRRDALNGLIEAYNGEDIRKAFEKVERSEFLKGRNERGWKADFDWVIRKDNFPKILEGKYDDYEKPAEDRPENSTFDTDEFFETALKKSYGGKT